MESYSHQEIEKKWQEVWGKIHINSIDLKNAKKPFYNLMMFPYPSAEGLHVGNMYAFTGSDILGRFKRMQGYDVFEPIGLDGFGIHSENYAIKIGKNPMEHAKVTEQNFYRQLHTIGSMYDWSRTVETYNTNYYTHTQWIFLALFKRGLVYRTKAPVNWCPGCKTVLSDEQVIDGKCERTGDTVIKKDLEQWFFRITAYAQKLHDHIPELDWSEKVKVAQSNWIGKKEGINITYTVVTEDGKQIDTISCFTTRPDTNFGATFVVIAPEHPFISQVSKVLDKNTLTSIQKYIETTKNLSPDDRIAQARKKTGVFTGLYCVNNLNNYKMPLYVSDFVLMGFGTGAVVGVPGHDTRDFEFAEVFHLPVKRVVIGKDGKKDNITTIEDVQEDEGTMIHSEFLDGMEIHQATGKIMDYLEEKGWGKRVTSYHLRDWLISRQRYWGPPIPMIYCEACAKAHKSWFTTKEAQENVSKVDNKEYFDTKVDTMMGWYPVPEDQLPVALPAITDFKPGDDGIPPLAKHKEFYETTCPGCGGKAVRETEVSDTFLDSAWYFLRYPSIATEKLDDGSSKLEKRKDPISKIQNQNSNLPWDPEITKKWLPVTMYTGGAEHSVLHLMYSRFITMALHDMGYIDFDEPFAKFFAHGLVIKDGAKMSKSKGNVVNPDEYIKMYGSDALRLYLMFMGPYSDGGDFRDSAMEGMSRWVIRVWKMAQTVMSGELSVMSNKDVEKTLHKLIKKVGDDIESRHYNTSIARMMEFTNLVADVKFALSLEDLKTFIKLLAPFAPHMTEELWQQIHGRTALEKVSDSVHVASWPVYEEKFLQAEMMQIVIQVNGKVRDKLTVSVSEAGNEQKIIALAKEQSNVSKHIEGKTIQKAIYIQGKIVNFVIE